jgi:hypothetical protein
LDRVQGKGVRRVLKQGRGSREEGIENAEEAEVPEVSQRRTETNAMGAKWVWRLCVAP